MAVGSGNTLQSCAAVACENGFNLQKEGHVLMTGCTAEKCTVCGVRLDATPASLLHNVFQDNWVGSMAYGGVSVDLAGNLFENTAGCALYLRDIGFSRFIGNTFSGSLQSSVQGIGGLGGSVWIGNELDLPADFSGAAEQFALTD